MKKTRSQKSRDTVPLRGIEGDVYLRLRLMEAERNWKGRVPKVLG